MKTIVLTYDAEDPFAQKMIDALLASGTFRIEQKEKKSELQKSIDEARKGNYFVAKDAEDLIAKCLA